MLLHNIIMHPSLWNTPLLFYMYTIPTKRRLNMDRQTVYKFIQCHMIIHRTDMQLTHSHAYTHARACTHREPIMGFDLDILTLLQLHVTKVKK